MRDNFVKSRLCNFIIVDFDININKTFPFQDSPYQFHTEPFSHLRCGNGSQTYLNLYICKSGRTVLHSFPFTFSFPPLPLSSLLYLPFKCPEFCFPLFIIVFSFFVTTKQQKVFYRKIKLANFTILTKFFKNLLQSCTFICTNKSYLDARFTFLCPLENNTFDIKDC